MSGVTMPSHFIPLRYFTFEHMNVVISKPSINGSIKQNFLYFLPSSDQTNISLGI